MNMKDPKLERYVAPIENAPSESEEERNARYEKILEKYDKNPDLKGQVCDKIFDIADHYVDILKTSDSCAEHEGFIEHMRLTADIVDKFAGDKLPVAAIYATMMHDLAQRLASPYEEVRDAAALALMEFYELPEEMIAKEEKNYVAEILRDLNDLGSQAYRHRKSLNKEKYEKNAAEEGLDDNYIDFGYVVLTNGVKVTEDLPPELWSIDMPVVNIETLKDEIHATNIEANVIIAAEALAHIAVVDPEDQAKQYRAYVEFMAMHGPVLELLTFDAFGGIAGRSTALRIMHEKLGHTDALDKAREILQDVTEFGGIEGVEQLLYSVGEHNIVKIDITYPDLEVAENAELKVGDGEAIDTAQYMDMQVMYKSKNEAGEDTESTKRIILRRKGLGSIAHKMKSGGDYSIDNPPADVLAATEIVGSIDSTGDKSNFTEEEIDKRDKQQLARNFVEELEHIAELKESDKLSLRNTVKNGKNRQPIFVQGGADFKQCVRDAFKEYEITRGEEHPLVNFVEHKEKDTPFEVAKFMCNFISDKGSGRKEIGFEKQFVTCLMRKKTRTDAKVAHVAYKVGRDQTVSERTYEDITERMSRLSKKSLGVNTNLRPDGREKITGEQFWAELINRQIPQDICDAYAAIVGGERAHRVGNAALAGLKPEDYGVSK